MMLAAAPVPVAPSALRVQAVLGGVLGSQIVMQMLTVELAPVAPVALLIRVAEVGMMDADRLAAVLDALLGLGVVALENRIISMGAMSVKTAETRTKVSG